MTTNNQRLDDILIKLDIMSQIKPQQRPIFKNKKVSLRNYYTIITPFIRKIAGESRQDIIDGFEDTYNDIQRLMKDYLDLIVSLNPLIENYDINNASIIIIALSNLNKKIISLYDIEDSGINALLVTYESDPEFVSMIKNTKSKYIELYRQISIEIDKLSNKYKV